MASRPGSPATEAEAGRTRPAVDPRAPDGAASTGEPQAPGRRTARLRVVDRDVARGHARGDALPLRPAPRSAGASRRTTLGTPRGGVAGDRVAAPSIGPHEVLALDPPRADVDRGARPRRQTPLADRAGLSRTEVTHSASITSRGGAGAASTITAPSVSSPMPSWRPRARPCPPLGLWPSSAPLAFPKVSSREALPGRPERNGPTPIATMYHGLARALLQRQPCRACGHARRAD